MNKKLEPRNVKFQLLLTEKEKKLFEHAAIKMGFPSLSHFMRSSSLKMAEKFNRSEKW